ncbi:hypothetical protein PaeCFBP13512_18450 [Paenibacillus sp. CFBP13512]|uniref:hypothetical protein n=1 Tax=Paenibacillus sp. CFBP13512 TaxID=2184007 RepID=UPI0010C11792|nr:hypothetical protein [Paenibacillus sp. CFBP13512]TKJ87204.1 hypothetical protein PaeCFBP13512_18450 [Paenibacillus sp. CFBP13512]
MPDLWYWTELARKKNSNSVTRFLTVLSLFVSLSVGQSVFLGNTATTNLWSEITNLQFPTMSVATVSGTVDILIYFFRFLCLFLLGFELIGWTFFKLYYFMYKKKRAT